MIVAKFEAFTKRFEKICFDSAGLTRLIGGSVVRDDSVEQIC